MADDKADPRIASRRIELIVRQDTVDLAEASDRQKLVDRLTTELALASDEEIAILGSYPVHQKLLLQLPEVRADALVQAVKQGRFKYEGIVEAFVCPAGPAAEADMGFERQPMVQWFTPIELVRAGVKAVLSTLFGSYADRREIQALQAAENADLRRQKDAGPGGFSFGQSEEDEGDDLEDVIEREVCDFSDRESVWVDYIADLGDGWDPTYTMARLLGEAQLKVSSGKQTHDTRRGRVLVMGGDQVYPTATREEYNNRLVGPYRAALPCVIGDEAPSLFAIPGNHDWYDGLTSFTRLFCQQRWIGGWNTEQVRSYFAMKLPHDWWLWGIDVQLESDIDLPQFNYFQKLAQHMKPGSKIILCTAEPSWVYAEQKGEAAYQNLEYFERRIIRANELELVVGLAGDLHTYARYEEEVKPEAGPAAGESSASGRRRRQRFISGGGGAYLYPSHQLPELLDLPVGDGRRAETESVGRAESRDRYSQKTVFPNSDQSRRLSYGALAFPFMNWKFAGVLGSFYLLFAWITQSATKLPFNATDTGTSFIEQLERLTPGLQGIGGLFAHFWVVLRHSPTTAILVLLLFGGLVGFADKKGWRRALLGTLHTVAHVILALLLMWGFAEVNIGGLDMSVDGPGQVTLFAAEMLVLGTLLGGILFGFYMLASNWLLILDREFEGSKKGQVRARARKLKGVHANEVFSSQSISDFKHFLRLNIRENGDLVIYPIGVEKICTAWRFNENAEPGDPWFDPDEGTIQERASLIEDPIVVSR